MVHKGGGGSKMYKKLSKWFMNGPLLAIQIPEVQILILERIDPLR